MAKACSCGTDKLRKYMISNNLYDYYCETHQYARPCEKLICSICGETNYESIWLSVYGTFDEAVIARLEGEVKYFKEYSNNYKPDKHLIALEYISKTDNMKHYIELNSRGNIVTNIILNKAS